MPNAVIYNMAGEKVGEYALSEAVFGVEPNEAVLHASVKNYLANQRQGTQSALTKGEVSYTTKKPWRQKGTGRARAGYAGSPVWRHGGVAFAPKPRDYRYALTKKTRRLALKSALSAKAAAGEILVIDGLKVEAPKTKPFAEFLGKIGAAGKPIHMSEITISAPDDTERGRMVQAIVARNLYRIWFSQKPSMGITWWNVLDDCGAPKEPAISGLFTRGMNPKPAFFALDELINKEWKTSLDALPDANGDIKFRGFRGKYRISWKSPDGSEKFAYYNLK